MCKYRVLGLALSVCLFTACTDNKPQIIDSFWQINIRNTPQSQERKEELSLYIAGDDSDGIEDLKDLYLINDKDNRYWRISSTDWDSHQIREDKWIGSSKFVNGMKPRFDRGLYRLILIDTGGSQDEQEIYLNSPTYEWTDIPFPQIKISTEGIHIEGEPLEYLIHCYDKDDDLIESIHAIPGFNAWDQLDPSSRKDLDTIEVYTIWEEKGIGLIDGPYLIPHV